MSLALFFGVLVLLLVLTVPICVSFAFVTLLPSIVDASFPYTADAAVRSMVSGLNNFPLLAIPLFIIAGVIMAKGQISERLFNVFSYFFRQQNSGAPLRSHHYMPVLRCHLRFRPRYYRGRGFYVHPPADQCGL